MNKSKLKQISAILEGDDCLSKDQMTRILGKAFVGYMVTQNNVTDRRNTQIAFDRITTIIQLLENG